MHGATNRIQVGEGLVEVVAGAEYPSGRDPDPHLTLRLPGDVDQLQIQT